MVQFLVSQLHRIVDRKPILVMGWEMTVLTRIG